MKNFFLLLFFLVVFASHSYAEPSATFKYLMNEKMTMMDWGLFRLDKHLNNGLKSLELINTIIKKTSIVYYDWDTNRITIRLVLHVKGWETENIKPVKEFCKAATKDYRDLLHTDVEPNLRRHVGIKSYFLHNGWTDSTEPENLMKEIENSTLIRIDISGSKTGKPPYKNIVSCESPLMGSEIHFIEVD